MEQIDNEENKFQAELENDNNSLNSEVFYNSIIDSLNNKEEIEQILNSFSIEYSSIKKVNEFFNLMKRMGLRNPKKEKRVKGEDKIEKIEKIEQETQIDKFLTILPEIKIQNGILKQIITDSLIKSFQFSLNIPTMILILQNLLNGQLCNIKHLPTHKLDKLITNIDNKLKTTHTNLDTNLSILFNENKTKFDYIFFFNLLQKSEMIKTKQIHSQIQEEFTKFYEDKILDDSDMEKNLIRQKHLILKYINADLLEKTILQRCEAILLRSSKNLRFLEIIFQNLTCEYNPEFTNNLFIRFRELFFNNDAKIVEMGINSIKTISKFSNKKTLLNNLLNIEFSADKIEQYINVCHYLVIILNTETNSKNIENCFNHSELLSVIFQVLKRLELMNENNKNRFETIINLLISSLYLNMTNSSNPEQELILIDLINKQLKTFLSNSNYSFIFGHLYNIITIMTEKFNSILPEVSVKVLFNHIDDVIITQTNLKNVLPLISAVFTLCTHNTDYFFKGKKFLFQILENCLNFSETNFLFKNNNFLNLNSFDFVNLLNVFKQISNSLSTSNEMFEEEDLSKLSKLISMLLFRKNRNKIEDVFLNNVLDGVKNKKVYDFLINSCLMFIINFFSSDSNINNNLNIYDKVSFKRLKLLIEKYSELFYQEFDDKDVMKFLVLSHIPNLNNDMIIEHHGSNLRNTFLDKIYNKFNKLELNKDLNSLISDNYNSLSQFIFSDLGIFNKNNRIIVNSCYAILTRLSENLSNPNLSSQIAKDAFINLNLEKLLYIDNLHKFYNKQVEYISFYDLTYLVDNLKILEKSLLNAHQSQIFNFSNQNENVNVKVTQNVINTSQSNTGKKTTQKGNKPQKTQTVEKVDKEAKTKEMKNYMEKFLINLVNHQNFIIKRLSPILSLFNTKNILQINSNNVINNNNTQKVIKNLWRLLKVNSINDNLLHLIQQFFKENIYTKNFYYEFSYLMNLQVNPDQFNTIIEQHPNIVINFNEKLENIMLDENMRKSLFENFDFVILKLIFFIILNNHISNEDKVSSLNILIKIIQNLPEEILNFNDISLLTVSLLKTSYNDDNLAILLEIFLKRSHEEHFLILCEDILDYEYVAKVTFLTQILNLNMTSLRKYKNLVNKIWILIFDENDNISILSKNIWNKFNLYLDNSFVHSDEFKLAFTNHREKDSINISIRAYAFIVKSEIQIILKKFEEFYEKEIDENKLKLIEAENNQDEDHHYEHFDYSRLRTILFDMVNETVELFTNEMKQSLLDFLMRVSDKEPEEEIFEMMNQTIFTIIKSIQEETVIINILTSIEKNIRIISTKDSKEINYNNLKIILMMLNSILINTVGNTHVREQKDSLYESLFTLAVKIDNSEVLCLISSCYQFLAKDNTIKSESLFNQILENFKSANNKLINRGELYILAGLVKCFGINTYKSMRINEVVTENMKKNKSIQEKQNAVTLIKVFTETLKRLFEPYLVTVFDNMCELIADREDKVRETTQKAIKSFMKEISGHGVKCIMPRLVKDLHNMNWKSKVVNIEILGQFAFCAPKQLSIYIPVVIKEIMQVFKDPHHRVQETAVMVLKDISSVIKNPEIVELANILIDAVANPYEHSKNALTALLETDFKHAIDPPSLALIIPIIDYNLKVPSEHLKKMAAHLIGSIANLIMNPLDIYQYIDIIIPNLKIALFDSIPDCRNAMAKAIGSLTKNLGVVYLQEMLSWVTTFLERDSETVQRSGAAQAYSEMLVAYGEAFIDKHILYIISKIQEGNHIVKEGYLSIFVFLPGCLGEKFEKYFELIFPLIIEGFSDDHENVRNVSNKIFEICIKLFAKRNTKQLVDPLLIRLFDGNWRIRNSSIALIKTLIMNLNKEFFKESSTYFTKELRDEILIYTFILKADNSGNTATIANQIWRDYVDNIPRYLSKLLKQIYEQLMVLLSSDVDECFDIAEVCIKMLATKFSDRFFMELLPLIKDTMIERKDNENNVYASFYIYLLAVTESGEKLLSAHKDKFIRIVNENINTPYSSVRKLLASIIYEISKKFDDYNMNKSFIYNVMKHARGKPFEEQRNLLEIVGNLVDISKGEVLHYVTNEIFRKPFEEGFFSLAAMISDDIARNVRDSTDLKELYQNLFDSLVHIPVTAIDAIVSITVRLDDNFLLIFADVLIKLQEKLELIGLNDQNRELPLYVTQIILRFLSLTTQNITKVNDKLLEVAASFLIFESDELIRNVGDIMKQLAENAEKEEIDKFIRSFMNKLNDIELKYDLEGLVKFDKLNTKFKLMMDNLLYLVQNGLLYAEDKLLACEFVQKIIDYTSRPNMKSYIMKMIGPMIRVLSEKFSPEVKERVLDNIKELIIKSREDVKGISPQLQSVFVKTLTDTSQINSERAQLKSGENILRLLQFYPRGDVIANDILKSIVAKFEKGEVMSSIVEIEILSDIVRFYGHTLKPNVISDHYEKVQNLINYGNEIPYDYLAILLSSYTKHFGDINKVIETTIIKEEMPRKLFNFIVIFNGNTQYFNQNKKTAIKLIKSLSKDQSVILLKSLGKIINKYRYFIEFDRENIQATLNDYEKIVESIILETELLIPSNNILDANLGVFILSLGYMNCYEHEDLFNKTFSFILGLIQQGKVNSQLLVNCLSLLVDKEIKQTPDRDSIIHNLEGMNVDEKDVDAVDSFLKKIYYLYK